MTRLLKGLTTSELMVLDIPLVPVSLATVALESCFYGVFLVLAVTSIALILSRDARSKRIGTIYLSPIFIGAIALFVTITTHWVLTVDRSFLAFIYFADGTFPLGFYGDLSQITEVVKTGFLMATLSIGDALIIHRLWIVWGRNKYVIIFPLCTLTGLTVCGAGITYQFTQYKPGQNVFLSQAGRWITSDAVFTLCTNLYSTVFISWRIWNQSRAIQPYSGGQSLKSVLSIIIESAALYSSWSLFFFASYQSRSNLQFIAVDCWPAMSGISCMLIHVRVGLGWAHKEEKSFIGGSSTVTSGQRQPFAVNITRAVDTNRDEDYTLDELREGGGSKGFV
ncbi:hypothetical protein DFH08DRAFT_941244 [Mycena albidolilacea]|uniref:Uncharacterized protein n=1 Tax=Mycena albidolilacea TaxID=1033008 RepID=A0AAD6ZJ07_9AGAR|nr:hypothetical protein DFH08DRAFT_941244 [Mycena albidolilacea]